MDPLPRTTGHVLIFGQTEGPSVAFLSEQTDFAGLPRCSAEDSKNTDLKEALGSKAKINLKCVKCSTSCLLSHPSLRTDTENSASDVKKELHTRCPSGRGPAQSRGSWHQLHATRRPLAACRQAFRARG